MSPESLERPCIVGPRNETADERVDSSEGSSHENSDRPLWIASDNNPGPLLSNDNTDVGSSGGSRDLEDIGHTDESGHGETFSPLADSRHENDGPLRESADEDQIGPLGESRNQGDGLRHNSLGAEEREAEERGSPNARNELMQVAARSIHMISEIGTSAGCASSSYTAATCSTEPQALFASSRKRSREPEENLEERESPPQQKRMRMEDRARMDGILGITRRDITAAIPPSTPLASTPSTSSRKRSREPEDILEEQESPPQQKRVRVEDRIRMDGILGITRADVTAAMNPPSISVTTKMNTQQNQKRARSCDDDSEDNPRKRVRLYEQLGESIDEEEEYVSGGNIDAAQDAGIPLVNKTTLSHEIEETTLVDAETKSQKQDSVEGGDFTAEDEETPGEETPENFDNTAPATTQWETAHGINSYCANIPVPDMAVYDVEGIRRPFYLPTSPGVPNRPWTNEEKEDLRAYIQDYKIVDWMSLSRSTSRDERELQGMYLDIVTARNIQAGRSRLAGIPELYPNLAPAPPHQEESQTLDQTDRVTIKQEETENTNGNGAFQMRAAIAESEINDDEYMDEHWMRRHAPSSERLNDTDLDEENDPKIKQGDCDAEHDSLYAVSEEEGDSEIKQEECDAEHDVQYDSSEEEEDVEIKQENTDDDWYTRRDLLEQDFERDTLNA